MSKDPLATLRSFFEHRWYCGVTATGFHNGASCIPKDPHDASWGCSYRWIAPPLYDTRANRELLGREANGKSTPTVSPGTRVLTARRIVDPQMPGVVKSVDLDASTIEITWENGRTTTERYGDLGVTWVFAAKEEGEHVADP